MIYYPFFGFPNYRRYYYQSHNNHLHNSNVSSHKNESQHYVYNPPQKENNPFCHGTEQKEATLEEANCSYDNQVFDFFGLKLHFDDILIILLIFFLYKEETDDMYLYIALFLLLFS